MICRHLYDNCQDLLNKKTCFFHVGTMQMLDARHIELFLSEGFKDGSWEYELIGSHKIEKNVQGASAGIFDVNHFKDCQSSGKSSYIMLIQLTVSCLCRQERFSI